ncbi:AAA family ATPase [Intestinibacter sp.]|uniref:AAA family ATPase n=1 Tax=Intestinibacter sp. TaxID=1965304 RepID=UPI003F1402C2
MLLRFNVKNFLSFDDNTELSMFSGKVRQKENHLIKTNKANLLKFAAVYGANASGKSNLIKAMFYSRDIILKSIKDIPRESFFKGNPQNKYKNTSFEYEILIDNKYYAYGFNVIISKKEITGEWLYDISNNKEKLIFERNLENNEFKHGMKFKDINNKTRFDVYFEDSKLNNKTLFLNEINRSKNILYQNNNEFMIFRKIYKWFYDTLDINFASAPITNFQYMLSDDMNFNENIVKTLNLFGTGITNFNLIESDIDEVRRDLPRILLEDVKEKLLNGLATTINIRGNEQFYEITLDENKNLKIKVLAFKHENQEMDFYLSEESDGTRRLMDLIEILLNSEDKVFVIDEIDRSLHPNLTYKFIELFLEIAEQKNVQLIVTTHEDAILDLELLRRDEVWFAEKDNKGKTELYSLEDFGPRFDKKILKAYLEGRYGAIPHFKKFNIEEFKNLY